MDEWEGASQDPPSLHKYLFASNNAPNWSDPSGAMTLKEIFITALTLYGLVTNTIGFFGHTHKALNARTSEEALVEGGLALLDFIGILLAFVGGGGISPGSRLAVAGAGGGGFYVNQIAKTSSTLSIELAGASATSGTVGLLAMTASDGGGSGGSGGGDGGGINEPPLEGSGPAPGILEISGRAKSLKLANPNIS